MQDVQILRNETYLWYVAMTKDEAQRRRWTFYEAVIIKPNYALWVSTGPILVSHRAHRVSEFLKQNC